MPNAFSCSTPTSGLPNNDSSSTAGTPPACSVRSTGSVYTPSTMSWPAGLPSCSSVAVMSSRSSAIWKTIPNDSPYSVSASMVARSRSATRPPMRAAVANNEAVFPLMLLR